MRACLERPRTLVPTNPSIVGYDHLFAMTSVKNRTPTTSLPGLLSNFVSHFRRAIQQEMEAMRERRGSFEVVLTDGQRTVLDEPASGVAYTFRALSLDEKLVVGLECTLRTSDSEVLVRIDRIDGSDVTLWSERPVVLTDRRAVRDLSMVSGDKLLKVLEDRPHRFAVGGRDAVRQARRTFEPRNDQGHGSLDASQRAAVSSARTAIIVRVGTARHRRRRPSPTSSANCWHSGCGFSSCPRPMPHWIRRSRRSRRTLRWARRFTPGQW
jgi:hypothetical protein